MARGGARRGWLWRWGCCWRHAAPAAHLSAATATATVPAGQATATLASATDTPASNPTATPASVAQSGSLDICQPVTPTPVQISVPAEIPVYQSGQIKLAEANTVTNTSEFGFCIPDTVSAVASFYAQALPGGWATSRRS